MVVCALKTGGGRVASIEKPLEMPYWNLLCIQRIGLLVYVFSVSKNKITTPYAKKLDWFK